MRQLIYFATASFFLCVISWILEGVTLYFSVKRAYVEDKKNSKIFFKITNFAEKLTGISFKLTIITILVIVLKVIFKI